MKKYKYKKILFSIVLALATASLAAQNYPLDSIKQAGTYLISSKMSVEELDGRNTFKSLSNSTGINDWLFFTDYYIWAYFFTDLGNFSSVVRFTASDLKNFVGYKLSKVRFGVHNLNCKHTVQVWYANIGSFPAVNNPIISQTVNNPEMGVMEIPLTSPVSLQANYELWIGIKYELSPMTYVACADNGPKIPDRNFVLSEGKWYTFGSDNDFNWYIAGYLSLSTTYTVVYNGNGATGGSTPPSTHTYDVQKNLTPNGFTREYTVTYNYNYAGSSNTSDRAIYKFSNWNTLPSGSGGTTYSDCANVSNLTSIDGAIFNLYARWYQGEVILPTPKRQGYSFNGWYTSSSGGSSIGAGGATYQPVNNITLYAQWTANPYTISASAGLGGSIDPSGEIPISHGGSREFKIKPDTGYVIDSVLINGFNYEDAVASGTFTFVNVMANQKIHAKFRLLEYTVSYRGNGSNGGDTKESIHTYNVEKALTLNGFTRNYNVTFNHNYTGSSNTTETAKYTFKNWNKSPKGDDTKFEDGEMVKNLVSVNGAIVDLYAQWNSGQVILPSPERTGYTFAGWYDSQVGGTKTGNGGDLYTPTEDKTLYAHWNIISYLITAKAEENGSIDPRGDIFVDFGYDQTFTFIPNDKYKTDRVLVDGIINTEAVLKGSYTFKNVSDNHTISVSFILECLPKIVIQIWDDVLSVINNKGENGGHTFKSYQWVKDDIELPNDTLGYLNLATDKDRYTSKYFCRIKTDVPGQVIQSCPMSLINGPGKVFPNPTQGVVIIESPTLKEGDVIGVYNSVGTLLKQFSATPLRCEINIGNLPKGFYLIKVNGGQEKVILN